MQDQLISRCIQWNEKEREREREREKYMHYMYTHAHTREKKGQKNKFTLSSRKWILLLSASLQLSPFPLSEPFCILLV